MKNFADFKSRIIAKSAEGEFPLSADIVFFNKLNYFFD